MGESFDDVIRKLLDATRAVERESNLPLSIPRRDSPTPTGRLWRPLEGRE